ncbi:MAG: hypothetical protein KDD45_15465 [Bdellovibrionales bacterium]|nr:hypothetical protein [Bdellovibrionales bacterium]
MDKIQYTSKEGSSLVVPVFNGRTVDKMPELVAQEYTPISVAGIMEQRIKAWQSGDQELAQLWGRNYFDSGDGIMYHPDGRIKVVPDSETLRSVNPNTPLRWYGAQVLSEGTFDKAQGEEFSRKDVKRFANEYLKQKDVLNNPIWLALARGDKELLKDYAGQVYSRINDPNLMKIWVSDAPDFEAERLWCLGGLGGNSIVSGGSDGLLDDVSGRLVGVAPKVQACDEVAPVATKMNLEALMGDFRTLADDGFLTPKAQALYEALQSGKYNL